MKIALTPFVKLRYADQGAIGHDIGDFLNWIILMRQVNRQFLILLYSKGQLSNSYIPEFWRYFVSPSDRIVFVRVPEHLLIFFKRHNFFNRFRLSRHSGVSGTPHDRHYLEKDFPKFKPSSDLEYLKLKRRLYENSRNKYVLILQRSPDFHGLDSTRDTLITEFLPTIKYLLDEGYTVVRYGRPTTDLLEFVHPRFIDLTTMRFVDPDELTFSIIPNCAFAISSWYGPMELLRYYSVSTIFVNAPPSFRELPRRSSATVLFSRILNIDSGKFLNVSQIFELIKLGINIRDSSILNSMGLQIIQLSSDELCAKIKIYEEALRFNEKIPKIISERFRDSLAKSDTKFGRSFLDYENQLFGKDFLEIGTQFLGHLFND